MKWIQIKILLSNGATQPDFQTNIRLCMIVCTSRVCGCKKRRHYCQPWQPWMCKGGHWYFEHRIWVLFFEIRNYKFLPDENIAAEEPGAHNWPEWFTWFPCFTLCTPYKTVATGLKRTHTMSEHIHDTRGPLFLKDSRKYRLFISRQHLEISLKLVWKERD